jgi:hypothetical protein
MGQLHFTAARIRRRLQPRQLPDQLERYIFLRERELARDLLLGLLRQPPKATVFEWLKHLPPEVTQVLVTRVTCRMPLTAFFVPLRSA